MKKYIALFALVSLILPFSAFATTKSEYESANFLASKGIITTSDTEAWFRLGDSITRKEVMKVVMKLSGKTIPETCTGVFSDVANDWSCKYIEAALSAGYIAKNTTFRPDDNITLTEAMKLVLKAKGVQKTQETTNWAEDYMETAYYYGIIDAKYYNFNDEAKRGWIFQITTSTIEQEQSIWEKGWIVSDETL